MGIFFVNNQIKQRVLDEALYIISTGKTLRATAKVFSVSKSTVHIDMSRRLKSLNWKMYSQVAKKLDINFCEKHLRGGLATAKKFAIYKSWQNNVKSK